MTRRYIPSRALCDLPDDRQVTVCASCLCASCWQGVVPCRHYGKHGNVLKTVRELKRLNREHPSWWSGGPIKMGDSA